MDINDIRGLGSVFALIAFSGVIWWAYGSSRRKRFERDAEIPFNTNAVEEREHADKKRS